MKLLAVIKLTLCAGFVLGMIYSQPLRAFAGGERAAPGQFPYQVSLRSAPAPAPTPAPSTDDVWVDGRIITAE